MARAERTDATDSVGEGGRSSVIGATVSRAGATALLADAEAAASGSFGGTLVPRGGRCAGTGMNADRDGRAGATELSGGDPEGIELEGLLPSLMREVDWGLLCKIFRPDTGAAALAITAM